jgi:hypothetical protein
VPAAVQECRAAGIRVMMITGDYPQGVVLRGTESLLTLRWREMDSNLQYRAAKRRFVTSASGSSRFTVENVGPRKALFSGSGGRDQLSEP